MTGQGDFVGYAGAGVRTAVALVNALAVERAPQRAGAGDDPVPALASIFGDDPTWPPVRRSDLAGLSDLALRLRVVVRLLDDGDLDGAATQVNLLLAAHPAHPHLSKDGERWRLHHHPATAALVPMATAITAEALARVVSAGEAHRLGVCAAQGCDRAFFDTSRNGSRRFCSTACQNRAKAAAFRRRKASDG